MKIGHLSEERRAAACEELCDLIKALNNAAASISRKAIQISGSDGKKQGRAIAALRGYRTMGMLGSEQLAAIEARLLGTTTPAVREADGARLDAKEREKIVREARYGYIEGSIEDWHLLRYLRQLPQEVSTAYRQAIQSEHESFRKAERDLESEAQCAPVRGRFTVIDGGVQ